VLDTLQRQRRPDEERTGGGEEPVAETPLFRVSRALFGGVLAFLAVDNLRNLDGRVECADAKGAPFPEVSVPTVSAGLLWEASASHCGESRRPPEQLSPGSSTA
jgi:hypothetical protein